MQLLFHFILFFFFFYFNARYVVYLCPSVCPSVRPMQNSIVITEYEVYGDQFYEHFM